MWQGGRVQTGMVRRQGSRVMEKRVRGAGEGREGEKQGSERSGKDINEGKTARREEQGGVETEKQPRDGWRCGEDIRMLWDRRGTNGMDKREGK